MNSRLQNKTFLRYVTPSVASMWVYALYTMADGVFVARGVNADALAAVNLCIPYNCLVLALGVLFGMGSSTKMSMALGEGDSREASRIFTQNIVTVAAFGLAFSIAAFLMRDSVALLLGASDATMDYTVEYLKYIALFSPCFMVSYNLELQVKADGAPVIAAVGTLACCITNVGLDALFVLVLGLGVEGASLATGIAQAASMLIFIGYFLFRGKHIRFAKFRFCLRRLKETLSLGVSGFVGELDASFTALLFNRIITRVGGGTGLIAYTVVAYVQTFVANTMMGISQGTCPLISYCCGAKDVDGERAYRRKALITLGATGALMTAGVIVFAPAISSAYLDASHAAYAVSVHALRWYAPAFLLIGFALFAVNDCMAIGRGGTALVLSLLSLGLTCVSVLALGLLLGSDGVWFSAAAAKILFLPVALFAHARMHKKNAVRGVPLHS